MSYPNIPNITPLISVTVGQTIPLLLSSIALEELALAHIINAEAEKLQFVLGTLDTGVTFTPAEVSLGDLLDVNASVQRTLRDVIKKEMLLEFKFENVLDLIPIIPTLPPVLLSTQTFTGPSIQTITVPIGATSARITAVGAAGGNGLQAPVTIFTGGAGASIQGDFPVTGGETLSILAGGTGTSGATLNFSGGGGGGSFAGRGTPFSAFLPGNLLVAAGGGGGAGAGADGVNASTGTSGTAGSPSGGAGGAGGNGGAGGAGLFGSGGGGAGVLTSGGNGADTGVDLGGDGGQAISAGAAGGAAGTFGGSGGFGGGGGSGADGGGGGGFSGGGGGQALGLPFSGGGGGGSFNGGPNQVNTLGVGTGMGTVTISFFG
jgi:hypothetical protein